jgi:hypothetical protein
MMMGAVLLVLGQHRVGVGLAFGGVTGCDAVNDALSLLVADLLVVVDNVAQVVATTIMGFAHAHRVVCEVHIAVVAEDCQVSKQSAWFGTRRRVPKAIDFTFRHCDRLRMIDPMYIECGDKR